VSVLSIWRELGDKRASPVARYMGLVALNQGDYVSARALHEEACLSDGR